MINLIPPKELHSTHLINEYNEIPKIVQKCIRTAVLEDLPIKYNLVEDRHEAFFLDKMEFLHKRYLVICGELNDRGHKCAVGTVTKTLDSFSIVFLTRYNDYEPTDKALELNIGRLIELNPHFYYND